MSTLNRYQLAEAVGGVDDALIAESMEFFYPHVKEGGTVFPPAFARPRRVWRGWVAAGLAAAMLCGGVTVLPLLGGPDLWGGIYGVIAPLLKPDETEEPYESEYECEPDSEEEIEEPEDEEDETRKDSNFFNPDEYFTGGVVQDPPTVPTPNIPTAPDPSPNLPGFNWDYDLPNTPPGPTYNPGPGPVRNPNLGG
jgi:hypothetical protein